MVLKTVLSTTMRLPSRQCCCAASSGSDKRALCSQGSFSGDRFTGDGKKREERFLTIYECGGQHSDDDQYLESQWNLRTPSQDSVSIDAGTQCT